MSSRDWTLVFALVAFACVAFLSWDWNLWVFLGGGIAILVAGRFAVSVTKSAKGWPLAAAWGAVLAGLGAFSALRVFNKSFDVNLNGAVQLFASLPLFVMTGASLAVLAVARPRPRILALVGLGCVAGSFALWDYEWQSGMVPIWMRVLSNAFSVFGSCLGIAAAGWAIWDARRPARPITLEGVAPDP